MLILVEESHLMYLSWLTTVATNTGLRFKTWPSAMPCRFIFIYHLTSRAGASGPKKIYEIIRSVTTHMNYRYWCEQSSWVAQCSPTPPLAGPYLPPQYQYTKRKDGHSVSYVSPVGCCLVSDMCVNKTWRWGGNLIEAQHCQGQTTSLKKPDLWLSTERWRKTGSKCCLCDPWMPEPP